MVRIHAQRPAEASLLDRDLEDLYEIERELLLDLGRARLRGLPGESAARELRRVRDALEAAAAAQRLLEAGFRIR
jgi:hypothetical protein